MKCNLNGWKQPGWGCLLTERKLVSKCSKVMNISTSRTLPPSCMYCLGELSLIVGTPANILLPSERDSARSSSRPPPKAKFLNIEERSQERWDQSIKHRMNYSNLPYPAKNNNNNNEKTLPHQKLWVPKNAIGNRLEQIKIRTVIKQFNSIIVLSTYNI